jgi:hypothetical protein
MLKENIIIVRGEKISGRGESDRKERREANINLSVTFSSCCFSST